MTHTRELLENKIKLDKLNAKCTHISKELKELEDLIVLYSDGKEPTEDSEIMPDVYNAQEALDRLRSTIKGECIYACTKLIEHKVELKFKCREVIKSL